MTSTHKQMFEGVGAPVNVAQTDGYLDPTLDSCCQREIDSNRKRNAVETALRAHDRVSQAENQRRQHKMQHTLPVGGNNGQGYSSMNLLQMSFGNGCRCCYDPNGDGGEYELLAEARRERGYGVNIVEGEEADGNNHDDESNKSSGGSSEDDEFDYLLDEDVPGNFSGYDDLQAQRRAELENLARHAEVARFHGYGVHRQMHPQRAFAAVGYGADQVRDRICPRGAVLHLYDAFSPLSVSLDLCLEGMANRYPGTKFVRSVGITSLLYVEDGGNAEWKRGNLPMLLALRDGKVVGWSSGLRDFYRDGSVEVEFKVVEQWLDNVNVLQNNAPPMDTLCKIRPEEEALLENMRKLNGLGQNGGMGRPNRQEDIEDERYDCGISGCNKSFYHEHVGVKNEAQDGLLVSESQVASSIG